MAEPQDCATVLENFVHDGMDRDSRSPSEEFQRKCKLILFEVSNLPAELSHYMEEMMAKDVPLQECRSIITNRDNAVQKFVKLNGSHIPNPKEETHNKTILANYDKAQILQEEKLALSEKAAILLDRHIKRLDLKIRELTLSGNFDNDTPLPSLLHQSPANRVPPLSTATSTGTTTPLHITSGNAGPSTTIANSALSRLVPPSARQSSPAGMNNAFLNSNRLNGSSGTTTPASNSQRYRESSAGAPDSKRRRLNASLGTLPHPSSGLRQSSLQPGTPKARTPSSTRGGSAGPRGPAIKKPSKKVAPHHQTVAALKKGAIKSSRRGHGHGHKRAGKANNNGLTSVKDSLSDTGDDDSLLSEVDGSESERLSAKHEGDDDEDGEGEGEGDDNKYCTCQRVSFGDMVACDNPSCPFEWFHWECVGLTSEPKGTWFCPECEPRMGGR